MTLTEKFISAKSLDESVAAVTDLIKIKALHEAARSPEFLKSLEGIEKISLDREDKNQLLAFSLICKLAGLVRFLRPTLSKTIAMALPSLPASLQSLSEVDDRFYAATFWRFAPDQSLVTFLSDNAAAEETAELVRKELVEGLVTVTGHYDQTLRLLNESLHSIRFEAEDAGSSIARRLRRCLAAVRHSMGETIIRDMGPRFGDALREVVRQAFSQTGRPKMNKAREEAALEVITLLTTAVRMRLSVAFEGETYSVLFSLRDWFESSDWTRFAEQHAMKVLSNDIADALEISVRTGRENRELLEALSLSVGDEEHFREKREEIIERNLGLSEELTAWLRGKRVSIKTSLSTESQIGRMENSVASLMLETSLLSAQAEDIETELLPALDLFASIPKEPLNQQLKTIKSVQSHVADLAFERNLSSFGRPGEIVRYSSLEHQFEDERELGSPTVKLLRSGILSIASNGQRIVVKRALVKEHRSESEDRA
ncbi:hypothetical protein HDF12_004487 [Edaphobacter lichenicola]|uniref:Uncharacterized protein n=1 Tax=Tunturiibacter lichenicola TaxID=2051959 RepID=A0A7Y9NSG9_9BACT|nr:hypothetical protein [Edaphobacter lichenicola]